MEESEILGDEILFLIFGKFSERGNSNDLINKYGISSKLRIQFV